MKGVLMAHHELKIWDEYFGKVVSGRKKAEVRKNDRDFRLGDTVTLKEWLPDLGKFTGSIVNVRITDVTPLDKVGAQGFVVFSFDVYERRI